MTLQEEVIILLFDSLSEQFNDKSINMFMIILLIMIYHHYLQRYRENSQWNWRKS